jgi:predicted flap endonuclease-1-like 5' DNA nuclease
MAKIIDVEGIGEVYAGKLVEAGVTTTNALLKQGATPEGRQQIAEQTGISPKLILEWVNHVDLYRIRGVASEYSDLLEEAGVDSVPELARRNPANLYQKLVDVNLEKGLVRRLPVLSQVEDWIQQARGLPRVISHEFGSGFLPGDPTTDAPPPKPPKKEN